MGSRYISPTKSCQPIDSAVSPSGNRKPKSRLFAMKERIRSQRLKQFQLQETNESLDRNDYGAVESEIPPTSMEILAAAHKNGETGVESPIKGRRFQKFRAAGQHVRSKSQEPAVSVSNKGFSLGCAGGKRSRMIKAKSMEFSLDQILQPINGESHGRRSNTVSVEVEKLAEAASGEKIEKKGSFLVRSHNIIARLGSKSGLRKCKSVSSTNQAVIDTTIGQSMISSDDVQGQGQGQGSVSKSNSSLVSTANKMTDVSSTENSVLNAWSSGSCSELTPAAGEKLNVGSVDNVTIRGSTVARSGPAFVRKTPPPTSVGPLGTRTVTQQTSGRSVVGAAPPLPPPAPPRRVINVCTDKLVTRSNRSDAGDTTADVSRTSDGDSLARSSSLQTDASEKPTSRVRHVRTLTDGARLARLEQGSEIVSAAERRMVRPSAASSSSTSTASVRMNGGQSASQLHRPVVVQSRSRLPTPQLTDCANLQPLPVTARSRRLSTNRFGVRALSSSAGNLLTGCGAGVGSAEAATLKQLSGIPEESLRSSVEGVTSSAGDNQKPAVEHGVHGQRIVTHGRHAGTVRRRSGGLRVTDPADLKAATSTRGTTQSLTSLRRVQQQRLVAPRTESQRPHTISVGVADVGMATVSSASISGDLSLQKVAFLDHLAKKFPSHARSIRSPMRCVDQRTSVEVDRRHTTPVDVSRQTVSPPPSSTMSSRHQDANHAPIAGMSSPSSSVVGSLGSGRAGLSSPVGIMSGSCRELRSTLPVVRSPNKSMERSLGQIFLVFHNETKRALLPNEVTSLETVKALFVRSFPRNLSMRWFDSPARRIYILDQATNIFYELDDLSEVRHRAVLKLYEQDYDSVTSIGSPHCLQQQRPSVDLMSRSTPADFSIDMVDRLQGANSMQCIAGHQSAQNWSPLHSTLGSQFLSPSRGGMGCGQRHSVTCLPDLSGYSSAGHVMHDSVGGALNGDLSVHGSGSTTPSGADSETRERMIKMESQLANLASWVQLTMMKQPKATIAETPSPVSTAIVTTGTHSVQSSMSDIPSSLTPQPVISMSMANTILSLRKQAVQLRTDVVALRNLHLSSIESANLTLDEIFHKAKVAIAKDPELQNVSVRPERPNAEIFSNRYRREASHVERNLCDLELVVEEIRKDVVNRRCRVNMAEVEGVAHVLGQLSRSLAGLKATFPQMQQKIKRTLTHEMEIVVKEEKFLKDEPTRVEDSLKRSKKLMGVLVTLKKLAMIQDKRPVAVPVVNAKQDVNEHDRQALLLNIQSVLPNHEKRVRAIQASLASRARKHKLVSGNESMRFLKSLELMHRKLRQTDYAVQNEIRNQLALQLMFKDAKRSNDGVLAAVTVNPDDSSASASCRPTYGNGSSIKLTESSVSQLTNGTDAGVNRQCGKSSDIVGTNGSATSGGDPVASGSLPGSGRLDNQVTMSSPAVSAASSPVITSDEKCPVSESKVRVTSPCVLTRPAETCALPATMPATVTITMLSTSIIRGPNTVPPTSLVTTSSSASTAVSVASPSAKVPVLPQIAMAARQNAGGHSATPSPKGHVTFSDEITEFHPDDDCSINGKAKRVPPPPPPRKGRIQLESGSDGSSSSAGSPNNSEKIYSILRKDRPSSAVEPGTVFENSFSVSRDQRSAMRPRSARTNGFPSGRPLSVAPLATVDSDSDSSVSGVDAQQTGTIRRNLTVRVPESLDGQSTPSPVGQAVRDVFKIPPPVPVRKTSSLTATSPPINHIGLGSPTSDLYSNLQDMKLERALLESAAAAKYSVGKSVAEATVGNSSQNSSVMNLRCTDSSVHGGVKKCEETEIY